MSHPPARSRRPRRWHSSPFSPCPSTASRRADCAGT
jgi:hypothetical protein